MPSATLYSTLCAATWNSRGYQVKHIQNFTDVDDKIIQRAQEAGISEDALTAQYIDDFFRTMDALNILRADVYPPAPPRKLAPSSTPYKAWWTRVLPTPPAGTCFSASTARKDYGKLSHRNLDGRIAGARIQVDEDKEHPMDFVLWKGAKPGEPGVG